MPGMGADMPRTCWLGCCRLPRRQIARRILQNVFAGFSLSLYIYIFLYPCDLQLRPLSELQRHPRAKDEL